MSNSLGRINLNDDLTEEEISDLISDKLLGWTKSEDYDSIRQLWNQIEYNEKTSKVTRKAKEYIGKHKKFLAEKPLHLVNDCGIFRVDWHRVSTNEEMTIYSLVLSYPKHEDREAYVDDIANAMFFHRRGATQRGLSGAYHERDDCKIVTLNSDHPFHKGTEGWVKRELRNIGFNVLERF